MSRNSNQKFRSAVKKLILNIENAVDIALTELGFTTQTAAQQSRSFRSRTGNLVRSIQVLAPDRWNRVVSANAPYAHYVEFGNNRNGPWIYPKYKKALKFELNGQTVFAKRVRSHGPLPYMTPARDRAEKIAPQVISSYIARAIGRK